MKTGVGGCRGGCGDVAHSMVRAPRAPGRLTPTPAQAASIARNNGTYGDWVSDVPVQGPTDPGIRAAGCWWKDNVLDKVTDRQGAMVPRWTQSSALCVNGRPCADAGVGEQVRRGGARVGALGADPPTAAPAAASLTKPSTPPPPGIWSKISDAESHWIAATLIQLNTLVLKAGNKPCATWPADLLKDDATAIAKMPAAVACFQGWYNTNLSGSLRTDGTLDEKTVCALVAVTGQHAPDFPAFYPGTLHCGGWLAKLTALPLPAKIGIGVGVAAVVGGTIAAIAAHGKKKRASGTVSEARRTKSEFRIGQPVETTMGVRRTGKVIGPVPRHQWSDGTYRAPEPREHPVWVQWSDGTKGWSAPRHLRPVN